jgi:hypothetical protein
VSHFEEATNGMSNVERQSLLVVKFVNFCPHVVAAKLAPALSSPQSSEPKSYRFTTQLPTVLVQLLSPHCTCETWVPLGPYPSGSRPSPTSGSSLPEDLPTSQWAQPT